MWEQADEDVRTVVLTQLISAAQTTSEYSELPEYYEAEGHSVTGKAIVNSLCRVRPWSDLCKDEKTWRAAYTLAWERVNVMISGVDNKATNQNLKYLVDIACKWRGMDPKLGACVRHPEDLERDNAWLPKAQLLDLTLQLLAMIDWGPLHLGRPEEVEMDLGDPDDRNALRQAIIDGDATLYARLLRDPRIREFIDAPMYSTSTHRPSGGILHYLALNDQPLSQPVYPNTRNTRMTHRAGNCTVLTLAYYDQLETPPLPHQRGGILERDRDENTVLHVAAVGVNTEPMRFLAPAFFAAVDEAAGIDDDHGLDEAALWAGRSSFLYNGLDMTAAHVVAGGQLLDHSPVNVRGEREDEKRVRKFASHISWLFSDAQNPNLVGVEDWRSPLATAAEHGNAVVSRVVLEINGNQLDGTELHETLLSDNHEVLLEYEKAGALERLDDPAHNLRYWPDGEESPLLVALMQSIRLNTIRIMVERFGSRDWMERFPREATALRKMAEYRDAEFLHALLDNGAYIEAVRDFAGDVEGPTLVNEMQAQLTRWDDPEFGPESDAMRSLTVADRETRRELYEAALERVRELFEA